MILFYFCHGPIKDAHHKNEKNELGKGGGGGGAGDLTNTPPPNPNRYVFSPIFIY